MFLTNAQTSQPTTHHDLDPVVSRGDLDDDAAHEDDVPDDDADSAAEDICDGAEMQVSDFRLLRVRAHGHLRGPQSTQKRSDG
jgi:hypothetical protein